MKLNVSECTFMDVTLSKFRRFGRYSLHGTLLSHANSIKMLGVNVAHDLSWKTHTEYVRAKSAKLLGFVSRNMRGCSPPVKRQCYLTLIRPILSYGAPAWHPTTKDNVNKLQLIQNRASRFIYGKNGTHELDNRVMSHTALLSYLDILFFYKARSGLIDSSVTDVVTVGRVIRGQDGVCRLIPPKVRTSMYQHGFVYRSCNIWNDLPPVVKLADGDKFKIELKQHFLSN